MKTYQVLLAEDDPTSGKLLADTLERYNFSVTHVTDGQMALSKIKTKTYDLVISDIMMPYMDGLAFIEKGQEYLKNVPVIMLTSVGDKQHIVRAAQSNVSAYLLKPVVMTALFEKMQALLHLTPEMIIDKKQFPFSLKIHEKSSSEMEMKIEGCPWRKPKNEIYDRFSHILAGRASITNLSIELDFNFFHEPDALSILDDLIKKIFKSSNIRSKGIVINSEYLSTMHKDLSAYPSLDEVSII